MSQRLQKCLLGLALSLASMLSVMQLSEAQTPTVGVEGKWEGTLDVGQAKLRLILEIEKTSDGCCQER